MNMVCLQARNPGTTRLVWVELQIEEEEHTESRVRWKSAMLTTVVSESGSCALRAILAQGGYG